MLTPMKAARFVQALFPQAKLRHGCQVLMSGHEPAADPAQAVLVFGRAATDQEPVLEYVATLMREEKVRYVVLNGGPASNGYLGYDAWRQDLIHRGVPGDRIVPTTDQGTDTKKEADMFLRFLHQKGWTKEQIVAVSLPHQSLRIMQSLVASMDTLEISVRILPVSPRTVDWQAKVHGSQGKKLMARFKHIIEEYIRLRRYYIKGDLCSLRCLYEYLIGSETDDNSHPT